VTSLPAGPGWSWLVPAAAGTTGEGPEQSGVAGSWAPVLSGAAGSCSAETFSPPAGGDLRCYLLQGNVCWGFLHFLGATEGATKCYQGATEAGKKSQTVADSPKDLGTTKMGEDGPKLSPSGWG
jgi:hypothetical protein